MSRWSFWVKKKKIIYLWISSALLYIFTNFALVVTKKIRPVRCDESISACGMLVNIFFLEALWEERIASLSIPPMLRMLYEMTVPTLSSLTLFSQNFKDQSNEQQHANGLIVSLTSSVNDKKNQIKPATNFPFLLILLSTVENPVTQVSVVHAV